MRKFVFLFLLFVLSSSLVSAQTPEPSNGVPIDIPNQYGQGTRGNTDHCSFIFYLDRHEIVMLEGCLENATITVVDSNYRIVDRVLMETNDDDVFLTIPQIIGTYYIVIESTSFYGIGELRVCF